MDYIFEFYLLEAELESVTDEKSAKKFLQSWWKKIKDLVPNGQRLKTYKVYINTFLDKYRVYNKANPSQLRVEYKKLLKEATKLQDEYDKLTKGNVWKKSREKVSLVFTDDKISKLRRQINETISKLEKLESEIKNAEKSGYSWNKTKIALHLAIISAAIVILVAIVKYIKHLAEQK